MLMKKWLTLCTAFLLFGSMSVHATDYYVAHNGLLGGQEWSNNKEIMTSNGNGEYYRTYFAVPSSSTKIAFKVTNGTWTNPLGQAAKDNTKSDVTLSGSDNIEFTNSALQNITIWTNGTKVWVKVNDPIIKQHVLNGTKVMFYYGSPKSWGNNTMYFSASKKAPNADGAVYESGKSHEWKTNFYSAIGLFALNSSATYYLSNNNTWDGNGKSGLTAGCFADMDGSGSVTGNTAFVCTLGSTSYAITEGTASTGITSTVSGTSGLGLSYSLDHYYYSADGSTWNELPSDLSGLAVGTYTVKALATDGHIYMVSTNSATLTVSAYVPGAHDITATQATKWTYSSLPASETAGETVEFTVTPNEGYSVEVSSSDVEITKNGNTYSFTMPDNDVAISVVATALSYNITYPASPSHYTLAGGNPISGNTDATINITVTPEANYILTVTANGVELTGDNNVYSFTMPAADATIAVTAHALRAFDGSTPLYLNAAALDWWCNDNAVQHATFVKADDSEVVVTGVLEEGKIYAFTPEAGVYKSVKFSRHNPEDVSIDWGHTDQISLIGTDANNYVSSFAQNSSTATWGTYTPVAHTYTVAGDKTAVFGTEWDWTNTANDMVDQGEGTYLWKKTGLELPEGEVKFKVGQDYSWTYSWPSSDYVLNIPASGIYTITITFTKSSAEVTADATKTGEAVVIPTIALHSNITNPAWETSANFVSTDGNITASHKFTNVAAGNYEFGVKIADTWTANGAAFNRANNLHEVVYDKDNTGNLTFYADQAGDYTFTWTFAENKLEITYPDYVMKSIYINDLTGWSEVALYAYDSGNNPIIESWPGMVSSETKEIDDVTHIKYEIPEGFFPCTIIFNNNNNGEQTANYSLATAQDYYLVAESGILHDKDEVLATYHLYVRDLTGWEDFDVYAYGDKDYFGGWEGKTSPDNTIAIDGVAYKVYDFQAIEGSTIDMKIIFHNGVTDMEDPNYHRQLYDVTEARDYYFTVKNDNVWEGKTGVKRFRACEPLEHVYGYQFDEYGDVGAEWPGVELTADAEGWYEFLVVKGRSVVFNTGTGEGAMQTGDIAYTEADPVADEVAIWQGGTHEAGEPAKTYMDCTNDPSAVCTVTYERDVTNGNYGTIILPVEAYSVSGATLFSIAGKDDGGILIEEKASLLKGVPYIFLATADKIVVRYWEGQTFDPSIDNLYTVNGLVGFIGESGEDLYTVTPDAHNFILKNNGLYYVDSTAKIKSNRAFIDWSNISEGTPAPGRMLRSIAIHQTPTGIEMIGQGNAADSRKLLENGHLYIIKNGVKYNAQGIIVK